MRKKLEAKRIKAIYKASKKRAEFEKLKVLEELGFTKDKNIYQANNKTIKGNVQYSFRYDANYGFIFSVIAI